MVWLKIAVAAGYKDAAHIEKDKDGHIEIGDQEGFGLAAMALDYGGLVYEDDRPRTLAEAMAALEGLRKWFEEEGIEVES
jgi:hypothetical protein